MFHYQLQDVKVLYIYIVEMNYFSVFVHVHTYLLIKNYNIRATSSFAVTTMCSFNKCLYYFCFCFGKATNKTNVMTCE